MYGRICPICGAHLDPCERCDCASTRKKEKAEKEGKEGDGDGKEKSAAL